MEFASPTLPYPAASFHKEMSRVDDDGAIAANDADDRMLGDKHG